MKTHDGATMGGGSRRIHVRDPKRQTHIRYFELRDRDLELLEEYREVLTTAIDEMVKEFYAHQDSFAETRGVLSSVSDAQRQRLGKTLKEYFLQLMDGRVDDAYCERRMAIGRMHDRIGLEPAWYLGSYQLLFRHALRQIMDKLGGRPDEAAELITAYAKLTSFDIQIAIEAYLEAQMDQVRKLNDGLQAQMAEMQQAQARLVELSTSLAAAAEQATASSHEMSGTAEKLATEAGEAQASGTHAKDLAASGDGAIKGMAGSMQETRGTVQAMREKIDNLGRSSTEIGAIVQVIEDIARQTNLLALNAAIEAARAGDHGKGFAVVADEVRKLAERTAQSLKEISRLVKTSLGHVQDVVGAMERTGKAVDDGVSQAEQVRAGFGEILNALQTSFERFVGIASATQSMSKSSTDVYQVSNEVAKLAEQLATVANQLTRGQAQEAQANGERRVQSLQAAASSQVLGRRQGTPERKSFLRSPAVGLHKSAKIKAIVPAPGLARFLLAP